MAKGPGNEARGPLGIPQGHVVGLDYTGLFLTYQSLPHGLSY